MFRRRRPLLRTAVVGGGAYVAGKRSAQRSAEQAQAEDEQNERISNLEQQQPGGQAPPGGAQAPPADAPAPAAAPSMLDQLNQLTALHQQGALTDSEFSAAKAKLLGG
ncbi:MAG TPA: SHOCT domain-containing protein [Streptosporangiaceae bacterium]|nr:SHOCT domain-containing protein [Streptosporangiaceae bacterium]